MPCPLCRMGPLYLPAQRIVLEISIQLRVPEVLQPPLPGQQQVLDQEGRGDNPQTVVSPTGAPQLLHGRVNQGVSSLALPPSLQEKGEVSRWVESETEGIGTRVSLQGHMRNVSV